MKSPFKPAEKDEDVLDLVMSAPADDAGEDVEGEEPVIGEPAEEESASEPDRVLDEAIAKLEELRGLFGSI
jgi:hypothetical protein